MFKSFTSSKERDLIRQYIDTVETIIVFLDKKGNVAAINRKGSELLGYKEDELVGKSWFNTCLPQSEKVKEVHQVFDNLMAGKTKNEEYYENSVITKEGKLLQIAWHNSLLHNASGKIVGTLSSGENITDRKKTEEELVQSEEKFSKVFETSPYAITITNVEDGNFIDVNYAYVSLSGFTRKEALANSSIGLKMWVNEKDRQFVVHNLNQGRAIKDREYQFRMKSGEIRTGLYSAQMVHLHGKPYILSSISDITDRKKAEEEVGLRTKELEKLNKQDEDTKKRYLT